ncbi:Gfo/Idh/MocA family protein [Breznakia pachnodae]|uniref:Dehydrogenase n=1 Tax=Breznakia pachnodae TaxID=265178 RepID=A0ABU0E3L3_9FIRM|nr:Gfo/Idh/MocA family oxidoreductase [Breznakia pachnodae]MDQ0361483.1 putative dehydrogenase [Breznakia pachnodae]
MNIVIIGCGYIANRVAEGIQYSEAELYGVASRRKEKALVFAEKYKIKCFSLEECMNDENVDLAYIATPNPTHYELTKLALINRKHVICEKPFVSSTKEVHDLFCIAKENNCFLMEAHKTCFTTLNKLIKNRVKELGKIKEIRASFITPPNPNMKDWNVDEFMGGSFYDLGVYALCFVNLYADTPIMKSTFEIEMYKNNKCDSECKCDVLYNNGISAHLVSSWHGKDKNFGVGLIIGENGFIEIQNYWKSTKAKISINGKDEVVSVEQKSDFTGEINHAYQCIKNGLIESPIMSEFFISQIIDVLEAMKKYRSKI